MHDFADFFLSRTHTLVQTRYRKNGAQQILKVKLMLDFDYLFIYLLLYFIRNYYWTMMICVCECGISYIILYLFQSRGGFNFIFFLNQIYLTDGGWVPLAGIRGNHRLEIRPGV